MVGQVLLVGAVCHFSTQFGFAVKVAPHHIAALWPTSAILFAVLVATPVRHWFAYTAAAYFSSVLLDARAGFPLANFLFLVAGVLELIVAAAGGRRFGGGLSGFVSPGGVVVDAVVVR